MTPAINITTEQRELLLAFLRRHLPGVAVWAYGSRVKFTARPYSDLDLVAFATPAQRPAVSELKDELAESDLPFLVDLHIWDEVPERFHEIIRRQYVVVQETEEANNGAAATDARPGVADVPGPNGANGDRPGCDPGSAAKHPSALKGPPEAPFSSPASAKPQQAINANMGGPGYGE